jgi:hypothetical protein
MLRFPVIAFAIALIAIGRGGGDQYFDERRRDRIARQVLLVSGIAILTAWFFL